MCTTDGVNLTYRHAAGVFLAAIGLLWTALALAWGDVGHAVTALIA